MVERRIGSERTLPACGLPGNTHEVGKVLNNRRGKPDFKEVQSLGDEREDLGIKGSIPSKKEPLSNWRQKRWVRACCL